MRQLLLPAKLIIIVASLLCLFAGASTHATATLRLPAAVTTAATLSISDQIETKVGEQVTVPVRFTPGTAEVVGLAFSIDFDERCLTFDPQDADGNGQADAIHFFTPPTFNKFFFLDLSDPDGELDIILIDFLPPYTTLTALEELLTITFTATCAVPPGEIVHAAVAFAEQPDPTYTTATGQTNALTSIDGAVLIQSAQPLPTSTPTITPLVTATPTLIPTAPPLTPTATPTLVPTLMPSTVFHHFIAEVQETGILLRWQTAQEYQSAGFYLFRLDPSSSNFVQLTGLIASQGPSGGSYHFVDVTAQPNILYTYLVVEHKIDGTLVEYTDHVIVVGINLVMIPRQYLPAIFNLHVD